MTSLDSQLEPGSTGVAILGSTGSIGCSTLEVIALNPQRYHVELLVANNSVALMFEQCLKFAPRYAILVDHASASTLEKRLKAVDCKTTVLAGMDAAVDVIKSETVDMVMAAIVGAAGLIPTLAAVDAGKRVLLANKESLVMSGSLFMDAASRSGSQILPIDSEHNAIFQCLPESYHGASYDDQLERHGVSKVVLTASGGPFREWSAEQLLAVTPAQACAHPNWSMGRKISVDSATLMNKGLELIEACWLFSMQSDDVDVVVHPESVIHSMVSYRDGTTLAQMGYPDMRTPIAYGMAWPQRIDSGVERLNLMDIAQMNFEAPDEVRFPCLRLAKQAMSTGPHASIALNAANEVAVEAFLKGDLPFTSIAALIDSVLERVEISEVKDIATVLELDKEARRLAADCLASRFKVEL